MTTSIPAVTYPVPAEPVRGDVALAYGTLAAGVRLVTGYPGSPATGTFDALVALTRPGELDIHWAPNEKVAVEEAFGASLAGARALVVVKSVGLNIGLDPLATLSLSGTYAGMVILLGDDPGGWSSQNEQDTRWLARVAEVPIVEPIAVEQAAAVMAQAFAWSEALALPVIVRITRAMSLAKGQIEAPWRLPPFGRRFYRQRNRWIVLPYLVEQRHDALHAKLGQFAAMLAASPYDVAAGQNPAGQNPAGQNPAGDGPLGVVGAGFMWSKARDALGAHAGVRLLGLTSSWPLPEEALIAWLRPLRRVLVLEEGGPFIEEQLAALAQRAGLATEVLGRHTRTVPLEGEVLPERVAAALAALDSTYRVQAAAVAQPPMPSTVPLCPDCPYRPVFEALIRCMERHGGRTRHIIVGETGCMVRANLPPMELFDVKHGLGSGLGIAMGLARADERQHVVALVGDSSFFHSDINAMPYVVQHQVPMTVVVLDNGTTALTGGQAHPGSAADERGDVREWTADLVEVIAGCGLAPQGL
ncbi:MAG: thiamine pyrophosphate-dependent enzyme, partial [Chloroflexota bacterium]